MYSHAVNAYKQVDRTTTTGRETEARVLTEAALRLKRCQDHWDSAQRDELLDDALRYNQKIWSLFQSELEQDQNPLPKKLRIDILRLAAFIDKRIYEIMASKIAVNCFRKQPQAVKIIENTFLNILTGET